jgi:hypothetical protein
MAKSNQGISSKNVRHVTAPKAEPKAHRVREAGVGQLGQKQGNHITNKDSTGYRGEKLYGGPGYMPPVGPTNNVAACGVGGGRTVYKTGSQDMHGQAASGNPPAKSTDILSSFGAESSRGR